ncbi:MAG: hypothetical protein OER86_13010 [Phycisphaerae bacterium]|nr:hypothetical protein [Phycisphaerae bacterium]
MAVACLLAILSLPALAAEADEGAEAFDRIYAARLRTARATPDRSDDLALAAEMVQVAGSSTQHTGLLVRLCETARDLAAHDNDGLATAISALQLLEEHGPADRPPGGIKILDLRQRLYARARGEEKAAIGRQLIEDAIQAAEARLADADAAGAIALYRRALGVATATRSPRRAEIEQAIRTATARRAILGRVKQLRQQLEADPKNAKAGAQLVMLYLVDLDNPAQARKYSFLVDDKTLAANLALAARDVDALEAADARTLGNWYHGLANGAEGDAATAAMLRRAKSAYDRYLAAAPAGRGDTIAKLSLKAVEAQLDKLDQKQAGSSPGRLIDVLRVTNPRKHAMGGAWSAREGQLHLAIDAAPFSKIRFPVIPRGSYELAISFTRSKGAWSMGPILPVGDRAVAFQISWHRSGKFFAGLHQLGGRAGPQNETTRDGTLVDGHRYNLVVRVLLGKDEKAKIQVLLDGRPYLAWQGPISALSQDSKFAIQNPVSLGWVAYRTSMVFHSVKLRMLSGRATLVK